jgi:hypothetical protein
MRKLDWLFFRQANWSWWTSHCNLYMTLKVTHWIYIVRAKVWCSCLLHQRTCRFRWETFLRRRNQLVIRTIRIKGFLVYWTVRSKSGAESSHRTWTSKFRTPQPLLSWNIKLWKSKENLESLGLDFSMVAEKCRTITSLGTITCPVNQ